MKISGTFVIAFLGLILAGCSGSNSALRAGGAYCPAGTVRVCTGLYEPERELAPSCACADLLGSR